MKGLLRAGLLSLGILGLNGVASAATLTLYPWSPGVSGVVGNTTTSSPGPNGSFQANAATGGGKSEIYVDPASLFPTLGHPLTVGEIASMSYFTDKVGTGAAPDWTLLIYTAPTGTNDAASWYHARLNAEPYFTNSTAPANLWHQWSTNAGANSLRFYDTARGQPGGNYFGTSSDPTLSTLQSGTFTWPLSGTSETYGGQVIEAISFQTGSAWAPGFTGLLDGFNITLTNNATASINFEAVPVPSSVWAGLVLFAGIALVKVRRKTSIA